LLGIAVEFDSLAWSTVDLRAKSCTFSELTSRKYVKKLLVLPTIRSRRVVGHVLLATNVPFLTSQSPPTKLVLLYSHSSSR
jgi:hypothetical protein